MEFTGDRLGSDPVVTTVYPEGVKHEMGGISQDLSFSLPLKSFLKEITGSTRSVSTAVFINFCFHFIHYFLEVGISSEHANKFDNT